jgi:hypothetical protein
VATAEETARRQLSQWQCITHLGSPVNWYSMARHWHRPVVETGAFLPEGALPGAALPGAALALAVLAATTLAFAGIGNS